MCSICYGFQFPQERQLVSEGGRSEQEIDWDMVGFRIETGILRDSYNVYTGFQIFEYKENATRRQAGALSPLALSFVYEDELKCDGNLGLFCGLVLHFWPSVDFSIEGMVLHQKRIICSAEYFF